MNENTLKARAHHVVSRGLLRNDLNYISVVRCGRGRGRLGHGSPDADGVQQIEREMHWVNS